MLGILGGMGPAATVDFMNKIMSETVARDDQEHVPMIVASLPQIPDRSAAILGNGPDPLPHMIRGIILLETAGATMIAIPCNTAHYWYPEMERFARVRLLNLVHACSEELHRTYPKGARLGVLATRATYHTELYRRGLVDFEVEYPAEYDQELLMVGIASTKSGEISKARSCIGRVAFRLLDKGCDAVVMACTEIPLALSKPSSRDPQRFFDPTAALARKCVHLWNARDGAVGQ
jgi:aspartate racemase